MEPGGLQGLTPQSGGHALLPRKPPLFVVLHQGSIRNPDPEELLLLQPGQTGRERGSETERRIERETERRRERGIGRRTEHVSGMPKGADPGLEAQEGAAGPGQETQGDEVPSAGSIALPLHSGEEGAVAPSPETEREKGNMRGPGTGR